MRTALASLSIVSLSVGIALAALVVSSLVSLSLQGQDGTEILLFLIYPAFVFMKWAREIWRFNQSRIRAQRV